MATPPAALPVASRERASLVSLLSDNRMLAAALAIAVLVLVAPSIWPLAGHSMGLVWPPMVLAAVAGAYADHLRLVRLGLDDRHIRTLAERDATIAGLEQAAKSAGNIERELEVMIAEQVQEIARARRTAEAEAFERRRAEEMLRRVAHLDALTGLPNRALLRDRFVMAASYARRNGTRVAALLVDLDGFRALNDTHGNAIGDQLLVLVAGLLQGHLREVDTVARTGGDEFVVLISDLPSAHEAALVAQRILAFLSAPMQVHDSLAVQLTASIGIAVLGTDGDDIDTLLKAATAALSLARAAAGNACRYHTVPVDTIIPSVTSILRARRDAAAPTP